MWGKVRESCLKELQDTNQKPMGPFLWVYFPCKKCACLTGEEESIQTFFALEFFYAQTLTLVNATEQK